MNALAKAAAVTMLLMSLAACSSESAEPARPSAAPTLSDVPPPLVPAMPLPENAVENAVAKLDGIADELLKK
ncbi:MAG TPA: serine hydrolase, partial [Mycobacterium sp.]|nr:serine hydrolase [Mycobacterium sp.]